MHALYKYDHLYQFIQANKHCTIDPKCNGWFVINTGDAPMTVNGIPLNPGVAGVNNGESYVAGGNAGEIFRGRVDILFNTSVFTNPACVFVQKVYQD